MSGWLPIADAPRDEDYFFLGWSEHEGCNVLRFDYLFNGEAPLFADKGWQRFHPTHYMPLPEAPKASAQGEGA